VIVKTLPNIGLSFREKRSGNEITALEYMKQNSLPVILPGKRETAKINLSQSGAI